MTTNRGKNPNSIEALRKATESRKKDATQVHVTLSKQAIDYYSSVQNKTGKSRSQIFEELAQVDEEKLIELLTQQQDPKTEALVRFCNKVEKKAV